MEWQNWGYRKQGGKMRGAKWNVAKGKKWRNKEWQNEDSMFCPQLTDWSVRALQGCVQSESGQRSSVVQGCRTLEATPAYGLLWHPEIRGPSSLWASLVTTKHKRLVTCLWLGLPWHPEISGPFSLWASLAPRDHRPSRSCFAWLVRLWIPTGQARLYTNPQLDFKKIWGTSKAPLILISACLPS